MKKISIKLICESAIIAALYAVLTWILAPISYGAIQFRLSEVLILIAVFNPKFIPALIIGCFIANTTSSLGWYDMLFGTLATTIALIPMIFIKKIDISSLMKLIIASILPVISNAFIVSIELGIAFDMFQPVVFWYNVLTVGFGEAVVLYLVGVPLFIGLSKNDAIVTLLEFDVKEDEKSNIIDIESNIREKELEKMIDVEAMNRNIYADMESRMNQPSPLYDDDEMSKMLDRSNSDEASSKEDKERGPRGL